MSCGRCLRRGHTRWKRGISIRTYKERRGTRSPGPRWGRKDHPGQLEGKPQEEDVLSLRGQQENHQLGKEREQNICKGWGEMAFCFSWEYWPDTSMLRFCVQVCKVQHLQDHLISDIENYSGGPQIALRFHSLPEGFMKLRKVTVVSSKVFTAKGYTDQASDAMPSRVRWKNTSFFPIYHASQSIISLETPCRLEAFLSCKHVLSTWLTIH